ncbi:MAG: ABC transporter permease [bacterium]
MTIQDLYEETYTSISANKVRSSLTMLGIVIGISSVIAMISIGQGAQGSIQSSIQSLGSNLIMVTPGAQRVPGVAVSAGRGSAQSLTQADADAILSNVSGVANVASEVSGRQQVTARGTNTNTTVLGTNASYSAVRNVNVVDGEFITDSQSNSLARVAVIGPTTASDLFATGTEPVGQTITIKGMEFTVIGVLQSKGGSGFGNRDDIVIIPITDAQKFLTGNQYVTTIDVAAISADVMTQVQADITSLLLTKHNISDPTKADFSTINQSDIVSAASSVVNTFTILLGSVAGISLLVGGIGIMNMMLTTVTERTREIGLRKAIGAKKKDINNQFLAEAVTLTFIGGFIGILLGAGVSFGFSYFGVLQTSLSIYPILLAFCVSAGIGIIFGYYPARRAASLNPIEALRYE